MAHSEEMKNRGIDVGSVNLNLENMMKAKDKSVSALTGGINYLFKQNKVNLQAITFRSLSHHRGFLMRPWIFALLFNTG